MDNPGPQQKEDSVGSNQDSSIQIERAITDAQNLVAYTAREGIEVDEEILKTLIIAKTKWDAGEWSTEFTVQFWEAFRQMNQLIKPATVASVRAICLEPKKSGFRGFLQSQYGRTEASQTVTRYTIWTLGVLLFVLIFQIYWVIGNSLSVKLTELLDNEIQLTNAINQAILDHSEIEVLFKLKEEEGRDGRADGSYEFYFSPDWERETLEIIAERQRLEDELEALRTQLERNSAILLRWSIGWQWIVVSDEDIPPNEEIEAQLEDLTKQIEKDQVLINDQDVQKEIDDKKKELEELEKKLADLDNRLATLVNQAQTQATTDNIGENETGTLQVNPALDQIVKEREQVLSAITEMKTWLGQSNLVEVIKTQRQTKLDTIKAEKAALERQFNREKTKEESRRVRLSTDFALIILQSYLLPVLYGLLGASVYVLRTITREISNKTFSEESNRSYLLRLALGTLSGLIIGWFVFLLPGQSIVSSISPLALAFLVGYNIEIIFSLMDRLIERFTKPEEDSPVSPTTPDEGQPDGENQTEPESPATV